MNKFKFSKNNVCNFFLKKNNNLLRRNTTPLKNSNELEQHAFQYYLSLLLLLHILMVSLNRRLVVSMAGKLIVVLLHLANSKVPDIFASEYTDQSNGYNVIIKIRSK